MGVAGWQVGELQVGDRDGESDPPTCNLQPSNLQPSNLQPEAVWLAKAARLEEDRHLLLRAWEALDRLDLGMNGTGKGLTNTPEFRAVFRRLGEALTRLNARQEEAIAEGGGERAFLRHMDRTWFLQCHGHRTPVLAAVLWGDVQRAAREEGVSERAWLEAAISSRLAHRGNARGVSLTLRVRTLLQEEPRSATEMARILGVPRPRVSSTLRDLSLARRGRTPKVAYTGQVGSHHGVWVSLEEE